MGGAAAGGDDLERENRAAGDSYGGTADDREEPGEPPVGHPRVCHRWLALFGRRGGTAGAADEPGPAVEQGAVAGDFRRRVGAFDALERDTGIPAEPDFGMHCQ